MAVQTPLQPLRYGEQLIIGDDPVEPSTTVDRLDELVEHLVRRHGSSPAVVSDERVWSYAQIDAHANQLSRLLVQ